MAVSPTRTGKKSQKPKVRDEWCKVRDEWCTREWKTRVDGLTLDEGEMDLRKARGSSKYVRCAECGRRLAVKWIDVEPEGPAEYRAVLPRHKRK